MSDHPPSAITRQRNSSSRASTSTGDFQQTTRELGIHAEQITSVAHLDRAPLKRPTRSRGILVDSTIRRRPLIYERQSKFSRRFVGQHARRHVCRWIVGGALGAVLFGVPATLAADRVQDQSASSSAVP